MSGRVLDSKENFSDTDERLWFEVRPGEFVLSVSWKSAAIYMSYFENRKSNVVTMTETQIRRRFTDTEDVTDRH